MTEAEHRAAMEELAQVEEELRRVREMTTELLQTGPILGDELGDYILMLESSRRSLRQKLGRQGG